MNVSGNFPSPEQLRKLVSSFPKEWQGLFAALNTKESQAVQLGTSWLHDKSFPLRKRDICPHWHSLLRGLSLPFPVVFDADMVFWPKFACFTLKIQRNLLCFIIFHSERIPLDDMEHFLTALSQLPRSYSWLKVLVTVLQTKFNRRCLQNEQGLASNRSRFQNEPNSASFKSHEESMDVSGENLDPNNSHGTAIRISGLFVSKTSHERLDSLCAHINSESFPGGGLLDSNIQLVANRSASIVGSTETELDGQQIVVDEIGVDKVYESDDNNRMDSEEVMEIKDASPTTSTTVSELPVPPAPLDFPEITEKMNMEQQLNSETDLIPGNIAKFKEYLRSPEDLEAASFVEFVNVFSESCPKDLEKVCQFMEMDKISEMATIMLIQQFLSLSKECSYQATVIFAEYCIGSKLQTLQQAASRNFLSSVMTFAKSYPKVFIDGIILKRLEPTSLQWPQCDLILRVVKNALEKDVLKYFLGKALNSEKLMSSTWNDHMISLFSTVIDMKLDLSRDVFEKFVAVLQMQSLALASNLKFAKLVLTTINKHGPMVRGFDSAFQQILEENSTFLKKSALAALKKISR